MVVSTTGIRFPEGQEGNSGDPEAAEKERSHHFCVWPPQLWKEHSFEHLAGQQVGSQGFI